MEVSTDWVEHDLLCFLASGCDLAFFVLYLVILVLGSKKLTFYTLIQHYLIKIRTLEIYSPSA